MRILLMFAISFCAASFVVLLLEPALWLLMLLALIALLLICLFRKRSYFLRVVALGFGMIFGLFWSFGYHQIFVAPALELDGTFGEITGEAIAYSEETAYGIAVTANIRAGDIKTTARVYLDSNETLKPGDCFTVKALLWDSASDGNYYFRSEGIYLCADVRLSPTITPAEEVPLRYWPALLKERLKRSILRCVPGDVAGFVVGLVLGDRSLLSDYQIEMLKQAGIYHAMALSGLHLGTLVGLLTLLIHHKKLRALIGIPLCVFFTLITGCQPSLVRALIMECMLLIAPLFDRETDVPTSLGFAALLMAMMNPWCFFGWGTQLSYASVAGIAICNEPLQRALYRYVRKHRIGKRYRGIFYFVAGALGITFAAMLFSVPLMMVHFGYVSLIAPLTNLLTGMATTWAFRLGLLVSLVGTVLPGLGMVLGEFVAVLIWYIRFVAELLSSVPFAVIYTDTAYMFAWILLCYGIVAICLIWKQKGSMIIPVCCALSALMLCLCFGMLEHRGQELVVLDVGQGQCLLVRSEAYTIMVDCGSGSGEKAGYLAAKELSKFGESTVDLLILTHYDSDHISGVADLMKLVRVETIIMPETGEENVILSLADGTETTCLPVSGNTVAQVPGGMLKVFPTGVSTDRNSSGLAVLAELETISVLITGDMDVLGEKYLMHHNELPDVDVLVAGHHGAADSTSETLLEITLPEIVVISVGENTWGHPAPELLERLQNLGIRTYRTDMGGTLVLKGA